MKGFACTIPGQAVGWVEKPAPTPGPYDALLRPIVVTQCSSDVHHVYHMGNMKTMENRILGHEGIGEVLAVGEGVKDFKVGDRVIVPAVTPNWHTPYVQEEFHQHTYNASAAFRLAFTMDGLFAEQFILPDIDMNGALLPPGMDMEAALMASDMMTTGFHGVELAEVGFGDTVAVLGIGPVGLMAVAGSVLRGAGRIFAVGTRPNCVALAKQYGASQVLSYKDGDLVKQVRELNNRLRVDKVIIAGGDATTFATAIDMVRPGGTVANLNVYTGVDTLPVPCGAWGAGLAHKTIRGGLCPGGRRRIERMLALIQNGRVDPGLLVTHRYSGLAGCEESFHVMNEKPRDLIKPVVHI